MNPNRLEEILSQYKSGNLSLDEAVRGVKDLTFSDMGFANVDLHRRDRNGAAEVIYGAGKSPKQIIDIVNEMRAQGEENILITRVSKEKYDVIKDILELEYDEISGIAIVGENAKASGIGYILVLCAGTSDLYVAKEAELTARFLGNEVKTAYDVGVAGLHRLLSKERMIADASVVIAVAGMEGALASVVGGLTKAPVIAVPTSVGYGASFDGLAPLLTMMNSCAAGISVVNIDNGFGAGFLASKINHIAE